jgi:exoribonuclease R
MEETFTGILSISFSGVGFVTTSDNETILIKAKDLGYGLNREVVKGSIIEKNEKGVCGKIESPPSFLGKTLMGFVHHYYMNQVIIFSPILGKRLMIYVDTYVPLSIHDRVMVDILGVSDSKVIGKINTDYEICPLFSIEKDDSMIQAVFDLKEDIFDKFHSERTIVEPIYVERVDLTFIQTFTIDPLGSKDLDDAISVDYREDGLHLMVHIADVSEFIYPGSKYWEQVIENGSTFYSSKKNCPMIPRHFSDEICSIRENKISHVITNEFVIPYIDYGVLDLNKITYLGYYYSTVQSSKQFTYEEVDSIMKRKTRFENYYEIFLHICQITNKLKKSFNSIKLNLKSDSQSHDMIEVLMLWVNHMMAKEIKSKYDVGVFRNHPPPFENQQKILNQLLNSSNTREDLIEFTKKIPSYSPIQIKTFEYLLKDIMRKALYEKDPVFHFALGFDSYIHFTSPIRRAADLINHCILKGYTFSQEQITEYLQKINEADVKQLKIDETLGYFKSLRELIVKEGISFSGVIIDVNRTGIRVFLPTFEHICYIHISKLSSKRLFFNDDLKIITNEEKNYSLLDTLNIKFDKMDYDINKINWIIA